MWVLEKYKDLPTTAFTRPPQTARGSGEAERCTARRLNRRRHMGRVNERRSYPVLDPSNRETTHRTSQ